MQVGASEFGKQCRGEIRIRSEFEHRQVRTFWNEAERVNETLEITDDVIL
jgi:hypothetical protein